MSIASAGITSSVIQEMMPAHHLSADLLEGMLTALPQAAARRLGGLAVDAACAAGRRGHRVAAGRRGAGAACDADRHCPRTGGHADEPGLYAPGVTVEQMCPVLFRSRHQNGAATHAGRTHFSSEGCAMSVRWQGGACRIDLPAKAWMGSLSSLRKLENHERRPRKPRRICRYPANTRRIGKGKADQRQTRSSCGNARRFCRCLGNTHLAGSYPNSSW